ncbi:MAG: LPS assembly lipoprotein LptE [Burkholderiaceae bacterium]|jgi:LPS-assembly lipoprotein|nr:LPS assembly lipoprotein LptE [Burkholderiaceae bacterium]
MLTRRLLIAAAAAPLLAGCGFALRQAPDFAFRSIYVELPSGNAASGHELQRQLEITGKLQVITDAADRNKAEVALQVLQEARQRVVVGRDAAGNVTEFQLRFRLRFRVRTPAGKEVLPEVEIMRQIDQSYSDTAALSKDAEAQMLFTDMQSDVVQQVLRRLAAIKLEPRNDS